MVYPPFNTSDGLRMTDEETKQLIAAYEACISYVDYCVGILTEALEEAGIADDTVICLWTDHGLHMGEHGLWRKETLFEEASHVPLIIADPNRTAGVTVRTDEWRYSEWGDSRRREM